MTSDVQNTAEKYGVINGLQCVVAEIGWIYEHNDELHKIAKDYKDGIQGVVLEILSLGLAELRSIREMIAEQEAAERSEKDCLWTDGCD